MSSDNGIYILKTLAKNGEFEYRVQEMCCIENLDYDSSTGLLTKNNNDIRIENARVMFSACDYFGTSEQEAMKIAKRIEANQWPTEYGINTIKIDRIF